MVTLGRGHAPTGLSTLRKNATSTINTHFQVRYREEENISDE